VGFAEDPVLARVAAARSAVTRRRQAEARAELRHLPRLRDAASAKELVARLIALGAAGAVGPGTVAACMKGVDIWLACDERDGEVHRLREEVAALRATVRAYEGGGYR
jgi:hypothetical protein